MNDILDATKTDLIDKWLKIERIGKAPHFTHKSSCISISKLGNQINSYEKRDIIAEIENGFQILRNGSVQNWRFTKNLETSKINLEKMDEVTLERRISLSTGEEIANQVPVASGLINATANKRSAIDLVLKKNSDLFSFIELKTTTNNPLFASIEVLLYGAIYSFYRKRKQELAYAPSGEELLSAKKIELWVLAPAEYYRPYNLGFYEKYLNDCLSFQQLPEFSFAYKILPDEFLESKYISENYPPNLLNFEDFKNAYPKDPELPN